MTFDKPSKTILKNTLGAVGYFKATDEDSHVPVVLDRSHLYIYIYLIHKVVFKV